MALYLIYIYSWKYPIVPFTSKSSENHDNPASGNFYSFLNVMIFIIVAWRIVMLLIHPSRMVCLLSCCTEEGRIIQTIEKNSNDLG